MPLNVLLQGREVAHHLTTPTRRVYFAFEGTPELPIGKAAWEKFRMRDCTEFFLIESGGAPWSGDETPESYTSVVAEQPVTFRTAERDEDDTAVVLCTSGTTGHPKGAELRHRTVYDNALVGIDLFVSRGQRPATG